MRGVVCVRQPVVAAILAGLAPVFVLNPALAADQTVSGTSTTQKTLNGGDTLTIESGSKLSISGTSATNSTAVKGGTAGTARIINNGIIEQTGTVRAIRNQTSGLTLDITNAAGASITAIGDDVMKTNGGYHIDNQGIIWQMGAGTASGQALDLRDATAAGNTLINGSASNKTATIRADGDDALRPGANTIITNYGLIVSYGTVNTKCPDYLGAACSGKPSAHDAIDIGGNLNVVIKNYGEISGPRHGITADTDVSVTNFAGGVIIGRNGSGVGSDGTGRVINYGIIRGEYAGAGNAYDHGGGATINNGDGDGVDIDGVAYIENYGQIIGTGAGGKDKDGLDNGSDAIAAGGGTIINGVGGLVRGANNGILVDNGAGGTGVAATTVTNLGSIEGTTGYGIRIEGAFANLIDNSGTISGGTAAIVTGSGDDTLTVRQGSRIKGGIDLGGGTNTLNYLAGGNAVFTFTGAAPQTVTAEGAVVVTAGSNVVILDPTGEASHVTAFSSLTTGISDMVFGRMTSAGFSSSSGGSGSAGPMMNLGMGTAHAKGGTADLIDTAAPGAMAWGDGFGSWASTDASGTHQSAFNRVGGFAAGYDWSAGQGIRVGIFLGAATGDVKVGNGFETSETDSYFGGLYAQQSLGAVKLNASLTFGRSEIDRDRVVMSNAATSGVASYSAGYWSTFINPTVGVSSRSDFAGMPLLASARVGYAGSFDDGYTEEGGTGALTVASRELNLFHANAEIKLPLHFTAMTGASYTFAPLVGVRGFTQVGDLSVDAAVFGHDFTFSPGQDRTVGSVYAGFNASVSLGGQGVAFADFEAGRRSDDTDEIKAKAGVKFAW